MLPSVVHVAWDGGVKPACPYAGITVIVISFSHRVQVPEPVLPFVVQVAAIESDRPSCPKGAEPALSFSALQREQAAVDKPSSVQVGGIVSSVHNQVCWSGLNLPLLSFVSSQKEQIAVSLLAFVQVGAIAFKVHTHSCAPLGGILPFLAESAPQIEQVPVSWLGIVQVASIVSGSHCQSCPKAFPTV